MRNELSNISGILLLYGPENPELNELVLYLLTIKGFETQMR